MSHLQARRAVCFLSVLSVTLLFGSLVRATRSDQGTEAATTDFQIIVHPSNPQQSISPEQLRQAFFKRATRWDNGQLIRPVDLAPDSPTRILFSDRILNRSVSGVRTYWQQRIFSGRELPPPELDSDASVLYFVQRAPGAIGYISANTRVSDVKAIPVR